ncbi:MAG: hypothetical protein HUK08_05320 [Bacteroidaceae bacterium]|nr:hypothetical protein [Bacteroidaceae bacterium]
MDITFNPIEYLSGLTGFIFDKATLKRVAIENGLDTVEAYADITEEQKDRSTIALLECVLKGPWTTPSQTNKHGDFSVQIGSQTVTAAVREEIKKQLGRLYKKYDMEDQLAEIEEGNLAWLP